MKITYDKQADAVYIKFQEGKFVKNQQVADGIILDIGPKGKILGIEILDASRRLKNKKSVGYFDLQVPMGSLIS